MGRDETRQYLKNWQGEMDGAEIYSRMAVVEKDEKIAGLYGRLAETERKHAVRWEEKLQASAGIRAFLSPLLADARVAVAHPARGARSRPADASLPGAAHFQGLP